MISIKSFFKYLFTAKINPLKEPQKGQIGEGQAFVRLDMIDVPHRLLTNVYLYREDKQTTEIDIIYITKKGVYIFECKNFSGWISGSVDNYKWTQVLNRNYKKTFLNPIIQNKIHIDSFVYNFPFIQKKDIYSYVMFGRDTTLKEVEREFKNGRVITAKELIETITEDINSKEDVYTEEMIENLYHMIKEKSLKGVKKEHIEKIQQKYNKN